MPQVTATGRWVNANDLAAQWLTALGWPNTPSNRRALSAWFFSESTRRGSDVYVVGNNPLNITTGTSGNYRLVGTHRIAVYPDISTGISNFNRVIHISNYNYPNIVYAFTHLSTDGAKVANAIINSGWVTGGTGPSYWHTVRGERTNLLSDVFNSLATVGDFNPIDESHGDRGGNTTGPPLYYKFEELIPVGLTAEKFTAAEQALGISTDIGYRLTNADAQKLADYWKWPAAINLTGVVNSNVLQAFGKPNSFFPAFTESANKAISDVPRAIGDAVTRLLGSIISVAALIGGGGMAIFGIYLITKEATSIGSGGESMASPIPVFIRERS